MDRSGTVRGKVTATVQLAPEQRMNVQLEPEGGSKVGKWSGGANCEADGSFVFKNVPPGRYILTAKLNPGTVGKHEAAKAIEVKPGEVMEFELKLE